MDLDYMEFVAWIDRCLFPVELADELKELGLNESTATFYEIEWKNWNQTPHKFAIVYLYQCYCVGGKPPEEGDVGYYLKIWLQNMHKKWKSYSK